MKKLFIFLFAFISLAASSQRLQDHPSIIPSSLTGMYTITFYETSPGSGIWLPARKVLFTDVLSPYLKISDSTRYLSKDWYRKGMDSLKVIIDGINASFYTKTQADARYLQAESDPNFEASLVSGIDATMIGNWNTAYNKKINSLAVTGNGTKTITLTQQDGSTVSGTFTDNNSGSGGGVSNDADSLNGQPGSYYAVRDTTVNHNTRILANQNNLNSHTANTSNPHSVTKAQVGLSNVDNTSDANKPVSTATQTALNLKANTSSLATVATSGSYNDLTGKPTILDSAIYDITQPDSSRLRFLSTTGNYIDVVIGAAGDTANKWANRIYKKSGTDSVFYVIGSTSYFAYLDSGTGGAGDVTLNGVQTLTNKTISGVSNTLTNLDASNLSSGTVGTARLGTGSASSSTFLRGDGTWATPTASATPAGSTKHVQFNNAGVFDGSANFVWDFTNNRLGIGTATPVTSLDIGTGQMTGGTHSATHRVKLDLSSITDFPRSDFIFPSGGIFSAGEFGLTGTNDIFFQGIPGSGAGGTYFEAWNGANLTLGTAGAAMYNGNTSGTMGGPIYFRPKRVTQMTIKENGTINYNNVQEFADNAAALTGGLVAGDVYRTGDNLKIVH